MSDDVKLERLKRNAVISTLSLFFQSGYSSFLGLVANLVVTILLSPAVFGIYITVLSIKSVLNYFSDIGLAASLIQKKEIANEDLTTTFVVQQLMALVLIIIGFIATSSVRRFFNLPYEGVFLYWAILIAFFLSSFKTIPSILLERQIQFQKIVLVQVVENTIFYITVIVMALLHYGIQSFTVAVLLQAVIGLILIYWFSFWIPGVKVSRKSLKELLKFGLPFQASSFLALFKDDLINLYLSKALGFNALGYIGWAKKWAEASIRIIMDNVSKIIFPLLARFQDDKEKVQKLVEKMLYYQTFLLVPAIAGMALIMQPLVLLIPHYQKWQPALASFYIFSLSTLLISFSAPFINVFNALGKAKTSFLYMLTFTVLTWLLTPLFIHQFGFIGFPLAHLLVSTCYFGVIITARQLIQFRVFEPTGKFILSGLIMTIAVWIIGNFFDVQIALLILTMILTGVVSYFVSLKFIFKINIVHEIRQLIQRKPLEEN